MSKKVVIIGGGAVGMTVATYLNRHTDYKVVVFSTDSHTAYSQCGMPFVLQGRIPDFTNLIIKPPEAFKEMGIDLYLETSVNDIDIHNQKVISDIGVFDYDYLVIATGGTPFIPPIKGKELDGVFSLHVLSDGMKINKYLHDNSRVAVIGAGGIGAEVAAGLAKRRMNTTLVEGLPQVLPLTLDPDMAWIIQQHLTSLGVRVITGIQVSSINGVDRVESVTVGDEILPVDAVIMATGHRPLVRVAQEAGFDIGPTGAIVTNEQLRVSCQHKFLVNVYAGGECAQVKEFITGQPSTSKLGSTARRMARVIGKNISGKSSVYPPTLSPNVALVGDLVAGSVGITTHTARINNITVVSGSGKGLTRAGYYPGAELLTIKLLFSHKHLVGAQVVSGEGVKERIDALSLAIRLHATVDDLMMWETSYSPPVSMVIDPVSLAIDDASKKIEGIP
jgi:NADH oxidase (H2O2-forming)